MPSRTSPLATFLSSVSAVHGTGEAVPETSYYPAISNLLEAAGRALSPKVQPVINIKNRGSGIPDGGLFLARGKGPLSVADPMIASAPERGALEVKPPSHDLAKESRSPQVRRYVERYGKVLVTTLREWGLVTLDTATGRMKRVETFSLAPTEEAFWEIASSPSEYCAANEESFAGFLKRALEHDAPLSNPSDLAWLLAAHARLALVRIEGHEIPPLNQIRSSLSEALELSFEGKRGEHFFRSSLVQTLFYGVFSAWVLWCRSDSPAGQRFTWREAAWQLNVPMVSKLFEQISAPSIMRLLGVQEIMDWTDDVLARVDLGQFFARFEEDKAVQYFYEPFLQHFDSALREEYGVWYTPPQVVQYMVDRVDELLVREFGLSRGLADEHVVVLDPCVGTGSYLIAVLNKIAERLPDDALAAEDVKTAALSRVFGFEIMPAPFVVAHLQLGLLLARLGAPLSQGERVGVYLTNSLTGWDGSAAAALPFQEFEDEREAAHSVKRDARIVVVLGNPPYYPFAGVSPGEESDLIEPYKKGVTTKNSLNDLYVRFYRLAERRIVGGTGYGIVSLITNFSYLHEPGFGEMRRTLLGDFGKIFIDCLNGDSRETGKRTPDGKPDPSIFTSSFNKQGIQVGTAIGTYVRSAQSSHSDLVMYRDFWGENKKQQLLESASNSDENPYTPVQLTAVNRLAFRPGRFSIDYEKWPQVVEFAATPPSLGLNENRASVLIDPDKKALEARMRLYLDPKTVWDQLRGTEAEPLTHRWANFDPEGTRTRLQGTGFKDESIVRFVSRPLDVQWAYIDAKLWNRHRPELLIDAQSGNWFLMVRRRAPRADDGAAMLPATCLGDQHVLHKDAYFLPVRRHLPSSQQAGGGQDGLFDTAARPNLSKRASAYLADLGLKEADPSYADLLWCHALAITYAPQYVADNPGGIAADWPRIPLPKTAEGLRASAELGKTLAALLDPLVAPTVDLPSVIGPIRRTDGTPIQPGRGDLEVRSQWGVVQHTAVFPGAGKTARRNYTDPEAAALGDASISLGKPLDIYLNQATYWSCIPERVWNFKIGGFQVLKKWLSYREHGSGYPLLGRGLTSVETRSFTNLAQRLTAVTMMQESLDANYVEISVKSAAWS